MKTVRAVICDDDPASVAAIQGYLEKMAESEGCRLKLQTFSDGDLLLSHYPEQTDLLFLDVEMPFVDGIQAAGEIRSRDTTVIIVFMSRFEQYAIKGYRAGAWRYLLKPVSWEEFQSEMLRPFRQILTASDAVMRIKNDNGVWSIKWNDICYIEVNQKKNVDFHTVAETVECYSTLAAVEAELTSKNFSRCHNSFIVNYDYIYKIGRDTLTMNNGDVIPLSRHRRKDFMQQYMDYAEKFL